MHRRLAVGAFVLALIASPTVLSSGALPARGASSCTGYKSQYFPPATIRVYRTYGSASGTVQVVDFRAYVKNVMAWEWPSTYPAESLKAGAVAVKQYAWYYANHPGRTTPGGVCYDVTDTSADQIYRPETRSASPSQVNAVAATWMVTIRRLQGGVYGRFILTGYLPGSITSCGAETNGFKLYEKGVYDCGRKGKTFEQIARIYYGSTLELTDPGRHNIASSRYGDMSSVVPGDAGQNIYVHLSTGHAFTAPPTPTPIATAADDTLGLVSADVTGDGPEELLMLVRDGDSAQHVAVLRPDGAGYDDPVTWWDSATAGVAFPNIRAGKPGVQLLAGDFDADGVDDAALLVVQDDMSQGIVYLLRSTKTGFQPLRAIYSGTAYGRNVRPFGADVTGDGRADVVLETDNGAKGLRYWVLPSSASGTLGSRTKWYEDAALRRATTITVQTDWNRDGRDDLVLALPNGTGFTFRGLQSTGSAFNATTLYATTSLAFDRIKLAAGDMNGDGRGDVVMYARHQDGSPGTELRTYLSNGSALAGNLWLDDPALDWLTVEPY